MTTTFILIFKIPPRLDVLLNARVVKPGVRCDFEKVSLFSV